MRLTISAGGNTETKINVNVSPSLPGSGRRLAAGTITVDSPFKYAYPIGAAVLAYKASTTTIVKGHGRDQEQHNLTNTSSDKAPGADGASSRGSAPNTGKGDKDRANTAGAPADDSSEAEGSGGVNLGVLFLCLGLGALATAAGVLGGQRLMRRWRERQNLVYRCEDLEGEVATKPEAISSVCHDRVEHIGNSERPSTSASCDTDIASTRCASTPSSCSQQRPDDLDVESVCSGSRLDTPQSAFDSEASVTLDSLRGSARPDTPSSLLSLYTSDKSHALRGSARALGDRFHAPALEPSAVSPVRAGLATPKGIDLFHGGDDGGGDLSQAQRHPAEDSLLLSGRTSPSPPSYAFTQPLSPSNPRSMLARNPTSMLSLWESRGIRLDN